MRYQAKLKKSASPVLKNNQTKWYKCLTASVIVRIVRYILNIKRLGFVALFLLALNYYVSVTTKFDKDLYIAGNISTFDNNGYVIYTPHSGFHNQRIALENAIAIAMALNRTLVLPPVILGRPIPWQAESQIFDTFKDVESTFHSHINASLYPKINSTNNGLPSVFISWNDVFDMKPIHDAVGVRMISADRFMVAATKTNSEKHVWQIPDYNRRAWAVVDDLPLANPARPFDTWLANPRKTPLAPSLEHCKKAYLLGNASVETNSKSKVVRLANSLFCADTGAEHAVSTQTLRMSADKFKALSDAFDSRYSAVTGSHFYTFGSLSPKSKKQFRYKLLFSPYEHIFNLQSVASHALGGPFVLQFGSLFGSTRYQPSSTLAKANLARIRSLLVPNIGVLDKYVSVVESQMLEQCASVLVGMHLRTSDGPFAQNAQKTLLSAITHLKSILTSVQELHVWARSKTASSPRRPPKVPRPQYAIYVATDAKLPATYSLFAPLRQVVQSFNANLTSLFTVRLYYLNTLAKEQRLSLDRFTDEINSYFKVQFQKLNLLSSLADSSFCGPTGHHLALEFVEQLAEFRQGVSSSLLNGIEYATEPGAASNETEKIKPQRSARRFKSDSPEECVKLLASANKHSLLTCESLLAAFSDSTVNMAKYFIAWIDLMVPVKFATFLIGTKGSTFSGYMERIWQTRKGLAFGNAEWLEDLPNDQIVKQLIHELHLSIPTIAISQIPKNINKNLVSLYKAALYAGDLD